MKSLVLALVLCAGPAVGQSPTIATTLPGTRPLELPADWQEQQWQQIMSYYQRRIDATPQARAASWKRIPLERHRANLRRLLGVSAHPEPQPKIRLLQESGGVRIEEVWLEIEAGFSARALVFTPAGAGRRPAVIAIPNETATAEAFAGGPSPWLLSLVRSGAVAAIPSMVERTADHPLCKKLHGIDRRFLTHRLGFIVGRTMAGLEVEQVQALASFLLKRPEVDGSRLALLGERQGGMTALYAAAVDQRFAAAAVVDYFDRREGSWNEPVDRLIYGELNEFGDAEVAALIAPRKLSIVRSAASPIEAASIKAELARMPSGTAPRFEDASGDAMLAAAHAVAPSMDSAASLEFSFRPGTEATGQARNRHFELLADYLRALDTRSDEVRQKHWQLAAAPTVAAREAKAAALRRELSTLVGVPEATAPLAPRTRLIRVTDKFIAYDVMLGVVDGVEAYGHLLVPRLPGRRLPAVICQHGLAGQPGDISGILEKPTAIYHAFGARLADQGYVVFAPYVTVPVPQEKRITPIVRKAAALGGMRTGIEVAKLHRIVDFLEGLPFVDGRRMGYYGLSYGGYSAIWMGPLEPRLGAVIVSGHFNDWRAKITDEDLTLSFLWRPDEDNFNWNVLNRFTHTELIAAMWPRPVMVEFADRDTTTTPEWHERAWGRVRGLAKAWSAEDTMVRDRFHGVHEIGGAGSFEFLDRWLKPEMASRRQYEYPIWPGSRIVGGIGDASDDTMPFIRHRLDNSAGSTLRTTFHVSRLYPEFSGLSLRISRAGNPGALLVRYGTTEGGAELGQTRIAASAVHPLYDIWYEARVPTRHLDAGRLYYAEIRAERGPAPLDCYIAYGPRRLGGVAWSPQEFGFSYRVLDNGPTPRSKVEDTHEFVRAYLDTAPGGPPVTRSGARPRGAGEVAVDARWGVEIVSAPDEVLRTAAQDLRDFFSRGLGIKLSSSPGGPAIRLEVTPAGVPGVNSNEGFQVAADAGAISIRALTSRGAMRGVYWLEDALRSRQGPWLAAGAVTRNERYATRITTSILPGAERYTEASRTLVYTDGLLQKISREGFNAVWMWLNTEEAAMSSAIFPELDDPGAPATLARLDDVSKRAARFGVDVYLYLATGYNHMVPETYLKQHPDIRGYGAHTSLCTSSPLVRRYYQEIVSNLFRRAPALKGLVAIYDSEGFYYCGNNETYRKQCPRCRNHPPEFLAQQLLTALNDAMHQGGGASKRLIAFSYGRKTDEWVRKLLVTLPKDIATQLDFSKGGHLVRDGIEHETGDYNLTLLGPPEMFAPQLQIARAAGRDFIVKTEHAVSQEFIFVPYIPAMEQWYRRIARIRDFDAQGWFGNWCHYGYLASLPAQLLNRMSFEPVPPKEALLHELAARNYGAPSAGAVLRAWNHFSDGIRLFPYSDSVARIPGPLQKGPSSPFLLDPKIPNYGTWRSWQNDLKWTAPWGPVIARKYLSLVRDEFAKGIGELEQGRGQAGGGYRAAIDGEWRIARTIRSSLDTVIGLIDWITARDRFYAAGNDAERLQAAARLEAILIAERKNAQEILPLLETDSRLGYASEGGGVIRGGLFSAETVRWKLGQLDDVLVRQLPALTGRPAPPVPATIRAAMGGKP